MKKTGQLLKETREAKGISLQEVSIHLKISSRILKALEEGEKEQLPAKTFLRGFVQSYAQFLRLDGAVVLELFQAEMGTTHPNIMTQQININGEFIEDKKTEEAKLNPSVNQNSSSHVEQTFVKDLTPIVNNSIKESKKENSQTQVLMAPSLSVDHKTWSRSMKLGTIVIIILIAGIIYGVINVINKYEREATIVKPDSEISVLPRAESEAQKMGMSPENSVDVGNLTSQTENLTEKASAETITSDLSKNIEGIKTPPPLEQPLLNTQNTNAPTTIGNPVDLKVKDKIPETQNVPPTTTEVKQNLIEPLGRPQEVIVEALEKVTIEYSIDDKPRASLVLNAEKVHTFKGDKKLFLSFSDGASVNIIYNGKDRGVPGKLGEPKNLSFPE